MGMVVAATNLMLHQVVALKCLLPAMAQDPSLRERFLREARASARLHNEHVCRVLDVGLFEDNSPYIVMEMLEGRDLSTLLKAQGPMSVEHGGNARGRYGGYAPNTCRV
jgi:serine/threonine-protein kinase